MRKSNDLPSRADINSKFLLLLRLEPSMRPAPEVDGAVREGIHARQAQRSFEINLGVVIKIEDRGVTIITDVPTAVGQEFRCQGSGIVPVYLKFDGGFG